MKRYLIGGLLAVTLAGCGEATSAPPATTPATSQEVKDQAAISVLVAGGEVKDQPDGKKLLDVVRATCRLRQAEPSDAATLQAMVGGGGFASLDEASLVLGVAKGYCG